MCHDSFVTVLTEVKCVAHRSLLILAYYAKKIIECCHEINIKSIVGVSYFGPSPDIFYGRSLLITQVMSTQS